MNKMSSMHGFISKSFESLNKKIRDNEVGEIDGDKDKMEFQSFRNGCHRGKPPWTIYMFLPRPISNLPRPWISKL